MRVVLTDTTTEIKIKDAISTPFKSKIGGPQGHNYRGPQFELYFENSFRKVRKETGIANRKDLPEEYVCADDYDDSPECQEKKRKFK